MNTETDDLAAKQAAYLEFLKSKKITCESSGIDPAEPHQMLFPFQRDIVRWALRRGRASIFADCGLGKTFMQLEWARQIAALGDVLVLCPLAVAEQTVSEAAKLGLEIHYRRNGSESTAGITVTNYEMLQHFDFSRFVGVVLDESSIIKHYDGMLRAQIIQSFSQTPYRLACTATPAPNDYMELGNHAEFVGALTRTEMLSTFFVHDGGDTSQWRLKGHAESEFWKWVCSWAVMIRKPSDLGYDDAAFILPRCRVEQITVEAGVAGDYLFPMEAQTLSERLTARRTSINDRVQECAELIASSDEEWIIWCNLNGEADELVRAIPGAEQIKGADSPESKAGRLGAFIRGDLRVLVTKPSIAGFGVNLQHCRNVAFVGLSDSWEQYYQAVRRCWRFGQTRQVNVYLITSTAEGAVVANIKRKEADAAAMAGQMVKNMHSINESNIKGTVRTEAEYRRDLRKGEAWTAHLGDCIEVAKSTPDNSIDFSVFSPPFASLYTYSASDRDMGNARTHEEFERHFGEFLVPELFRIMKPGRNVSFHCMDLPLSKTRDGIIGLRDFRGEMIRLFEAAGFVLHSQVTIWKDPVTAMQRTKALGLLWKQIKKDSAMSRMGVPDYLVTMRKPGVNASPIKHTAEEFTVHQWQDWASPVWMDINPSETLQYRSAREDKDERHICPLQLEVIRRALVLWSNPGDTVFSPFMGIGSEGCVSLELGRKFVGAELKESYWKQAVANLAAYERKSAEGDLFATTEPCTTEAIA